MLCYHCLLLDQRSVWPAHQKNSGSRMFLMLPNGLLSVPLDAIVVLLTLRRNSAFAISVDVPHFVESLCSWKSAAVSVSRFLQRSFIFGSSAHFEIWFVFFVDEQFYCSTDDSSNHSLVILWVHSHCEFSKRQNKETDRRERW